MMSIQKQSTSKRSLDSSNPTDGPVDKRMKNDDVKLNEPSNVFSEKMYTTYIQSALESLEKNDNLQIDTLASKISLPFEHEESISIQNINIVLKFLIANISKLDNKYCNRLITALLDYKWLESKSKNEKLHENFMNLYSHFLAVLVSSLPKYLQEVTTKLVSEFVLFEEADETEVKHHNILSKIIKFIPTCINSFPKTLQKNFPHHLSSSPSELTNYVSNLMKMITYCPDLRFNIWQLIFECCIKLDVELQNELDDLDDDEIEDLINGDENEEDEEDNEKDVSKLEADIVVEGEVEYLIDPITTTSSIRRISVKLDSILCLLLNNTSESFTVEELNNGNGISLFNTITSLFRSHILPTHFTKSIQFILFHISQYQPELSDSYLVLLIDVAFNTNEILEKRLKAMQYLSSYIARAKNLSRHQIVFIVSYLIGWLNKYVSERECEIIDVHIENKSNSNRQAGGMERFKLFYAAFQALLYIFCFRYKVLYKDSDRNGNLNDSEWESDIDKFFQRIIVAKFNPLKYCDETVVYIFAKIATKLNVCYCYSIIEHNKRERMLQTNGQTTLPSATGNFKQKQEFLDLEAYFPFDPLVLPNSKRIISKNYVEWSEVNPSNDDDEDVDSGSHSGEKDDSDSDDEEITSDEEDI